MKSYNKTHCPDTILYMGAYYKLNIEATHQYNKGVKLSGLYHVKVNVLSKSLKGKTDLYGNHYKPNIFIYSNEIGMLPTKKQENNLKARKEQTRIKKYGYGV